MAEQEQPREKEIVLYNGSLDELNSRDAEKQYGLVPNNLRVVQWVLTDYSKADEDIRERLRLMELDGLVNLRTYDRTGTVYEGTPIVRVK